MPRHTFAVFVVVLSLNSTTARAQRRMFQPEDLFRFDRVGAISWSPDGNHAAVEIRHAARWLDASIPTTSVAVVHAASGAMRIVSPSSPRFIGFYRARWSPTGRRLLLLSVDTNAIVRPWVWTPGAAVPVQLEGLQLRDALGDSPMGMWPDDDHAVFMVRDTTAPNSGPLYNDIMRARNVADAWRRAREGRQASVSVLDSRAPDTAAVENRIVSVDVRTGVITTLARGAVHAPRLSPDRRTISYSRESPTFLADSVASFFGPDARGESVYDRPNFGHVLHHIDARTGATVSAPDTARAPAPRPAATLRVVNDPDVGSQLVLSRPGRGDTVVWRGNAWLREIELGRADSIHYTSAEGAALTGWLLYPPRHQRGRPIPIVTRIYPGTVYSARVPRDFDVFTEHFEHAQQLAALGYGVLLPSMPQSDQPLMGRALDQLTVGVLPLIDTLVARGIADPSRIAVLGQSAGGYAVLGLITRTRRFRTAIASASYSNLASLYGTFYGQYRHGDGGEPQRAQVLRMLQSERGFFGAGAPPWEQPDRYRVNSPIEGVANVETPLMLIHGEADFVPIQQAEEFFTALYRRDKRVKLVRYAGEGHTIAARANVLDMWRRITDWLQETMPPRRN